MRQTITTSCYNLPLEAPESGFTTSPWSRALSTPSPGGMYLSGGGAVGGCIRDVKNADKPIFQIFSFPKIPKLSVSKEETNDG